MSKRATRISGPIYDAIASAQVHGNVVTLVCGQLDRRTYESVNKVLVALGGKWNKTAKGHVFADDSEDALKEKIREVIRTGSFVNLADQYGCFATPPALIARVLKLAEIRPGMAVLEPSAGTGHLAAAAAKIVGPDNVHCENWSKGKARWKRTRMARSKVRVPR
jgi:hypothetical protein